MKIMKASILVLSSVSFVGVEANAGGAAQAAQSAIQIAAMAAATSAITGTSLVPKCSAPGGQAACVLMGLAFAQVGLSLMQKSGSSQSASDLTGYAGNSVGSTGVTNADGSSTYTLADGTVVTGDTAKNANALVASGLGSLADGYAKGSQTFKNTGIQISDDGQNVTLPNGKKVASSSMASADGMKSAGFSASEIANAMSGLDAASKAVAAQQSKLASLTNDAGGGGGGGMRAGGDGGYGGGSSDDALARMRAASLKNNSNVSGMSKKLGNDNIGVAGDDIFEMVSRRYQTRDKINSFLKN